MVDESERFRLIFLCTGNRARSAIAEAFVRKHTASLPVDVSSAGLLDLEPGPALPEAVEAAASVGLDLSTHMSRPLGKVAVTDLDLVIGFERQHVASAVIDGGAPFEKTFLLPELVELLRSSSSQPQGNLVQTARSRIEEAYADRADPLSAIPQEIADPFGGTSDVFVSTTDHIQRLVAELVERLFNVKVTVVPVPQVARHTGWLRRNRSPRRQRRATGG